MSRCRRALGAASSASALDIAIEARAGYLDLTRSSQSATALFETSGSLTLGLGLRADFSRFFLRASGSIAKWEGERVFVAGPDEDVSPLGHPLELRLTPVYLDFGLRFGKAALKPHVGLGAGMVSYSEKSTVGGLEMNADRSKGSARLILGATWGRGPLELGAEAAYSTIPDAVGIGGVSKVYDEKDLGGFSAVVTIAFRP